ncbi:MAG: hypothetical protein RBT69_08370, partial [Spirochaetia bacterium]|nr:hypothetical protein [Spirochaetia bacterium]
AVAGTTIHLEKIIRRNGLRIDNITVKKIIGSESVKNNCEYILQFLLAEKKGKNSAAGADSEKFPADVVLKEELFLKGFDSLNTVTLEIVIYSKERKKPLKAVFITEESLNTVSSNLYLYKILKKGIRETGL